MTYLDLEIESLIRELDSVIEEFMVNTFHVKHGNEKDSEQLNKVWHINHETAKRMLGATSQRCKRMDALSLETSYSTNHRMLRSKRVDEHFFMDRLFSAKKAKKSSRGDACSELFLTK